MITKKEFDIYFSNNYENLLKVANGIIFKSNAKIEPTAILSECYITIVEQKLEVIEPTNLVKNQKN